MLYSLLLLTATHIIPTTAVVDCRTACGRCDERNDPAELLQVYCSMCEECMERREEWLRYDGDSRRGRPERYDKDSRRGRPERYDEDSPRGQPERYDEDSRRSRTDVGFNTHNTHNRKHYPCIPDNCMPPMDQCQQSLSYHSTHASDEIEETTTSTTTAATSTTTTTTTTTRTTRHPSVTKNNNRCCCPSIPCMPLLPMCPGLCPMLIPGTTLSTPREKKLTASKPSMESLYFYLGVPKKMLKDFKIN